jgi:lysophospholipase L1-like esterase
MNKRSLASHLFPLLMSVAALACSSTDTTPHSGTGGQGSGGRVSSGGAGGSGGGTTGTGGSTVAPGTGGNSGRGGATSGGAGGNPATGGNTSGTGGGAGRGGTTSAGGGPGGTTAGAGGTTIGGGGTTAGGGGSSNGGAAGGPDGGPVSGGRTGTDAGTSATGGNSGGAGGGTSPGTGGTRPDGGGADIPADSGSSSFNPCPTTAGTACAIMPLGDSITEGFGATGNVGGYRIELFSQAVAAGKNITFVGSLTNGPTTVANTTFPRKHEGHGGWTIAQISGIVAPTGGTASVLTTNKPNIVLLMIGTNDINGNMDLPNAPSRLDTLIGQITSAVPSALVVVASIIPSQNDGTNRNFQTYNTAIPGVVSKAAAAGKHVVFLDNWAAFSADSSYKTKLMKDNLHPNDAGYVVLGQSWYKALSALLPAGS